MKKLITTYFLKQVIQQNAEGVELTFERAGELENSSTV